ncbi:Pdk1 [Symbiodinium sp. CCMP2456]|nr:Pdk1 [Symbiodinium sp. CCMP2456]
MPEVDKDAQMLDGATPLLAAALQGHVNVVQHLARVKADIHKTTKDGASALHACARSGHVAVARFLCEAGADKDRAMMEGATPLLAAALQGHTEDVKQLAEFLKTEYPIRCAERIQMIEALPGWSSAPELQEVHRRHWNAFVAMRHFQSSDDLTLFTEVVDDIVNSNKDVVALMAKAMQWLSRERPEQFHAEFVDTFLDNFLLNRLGSNVLLSQYLAAVDKTRLVVGTIDPHCDVTEICRESAEEVQRICKYYTQLAPSISIETHDVTADDQSDLKFAFIPGIISYIVQEILKNSARATLHHLLSDIDVDRFPINIVVSGDHKRVMIHISDRAGGIPFDVGQHVWSYLYTTALNDVSCLAGFGVGLPISRLYASYLGGSMNLVSLPGYGTHAYVYFPRLNSEQVVRYLCDAGADKDRTICDGVTAFHAAAERGHAEVVQCLCEVGADKDKAMRNGLTPLMAACLQGHEEVVRVLCDNGVMMETPMREDLVLAAVTLVKHQPHSQIFLCDPGKVVEEKHCRQGATSLHVAALHGHLGVVKQLCSARASLEAAMRVGSTPLLAAAQAGHSEVVRFLCQAEADLNVATGNKDGESPLMAAVLRDHAEVVQVLCQARADPLNAATNGATPLFAAHVLGLGSVANILRQTVVPESSILRFCPRRCTHRCRAPGSLRTS